jgi:hypothetical protein
MKQRLWWHHIGKDKSMPSQIIQKIDFDEASIMWTQWRKIKIYDHLAKFKDF